VNIARIGGRFIVCSEVVGVSAYDFDFDLHFDCDHPYRIDAEELCILRVGPIADYAATFYEHLESGLRLVNSPSEHALASELENWYPLIEELTPRTLVFDALPTADEIESNFAWPIFMKGSRQTSKHNPDLAIITGRSHYERAARAYQSDPILHWQKPVIREFIPLMPAAGSVPGKVPPSIEYRSFWWHGQCVGWGPYWYQVAPYACADIENGLSVARSAAKCVNVPFLVIDFAKTAAGGWIVIECNDAQESGYAGAAPVALWQRVLALATL
jgi:hypothetical protein